LSVVLIDDHLLLRVLLDDEPRGLRPAGAALATTGLWYHRLARALAEDTVVGSLSRRLDGIDAGLVAATIGAVIELPDALALVSLRTVAWPMADLLRTGTRLNLLSLEALAAARHLEAEVCLAAEDDNAPLRAAASEVGVVVRTIGG
jgi:hypothetical protein